MGAGDLNQKKSWHPQRSGNIAATERAEAEAIAERKKTQQRVREIAEERRNEEMQKALEAAGGKPRLNRVEWMYSGPADGQGGDAAEKEAYLLGKRRIDKILQGNESEKLQKNASQELITGMTSANVARDTAAKIREDPLLAIRKQEQDAYEAIMKDPIRRQQLLASMGIDDDPRKKSVREEDKHRRHRRHHRHHRHRDDDSDGERRRHRRESDSRDDRSRSPPRYDTKDDRRKRGRYDSEDERERRTRRRSPDERRYRSRSGGEREPRRRRMDSRDGRGRQHRGEEMSRSRSPSSRRKSRVSRSRSPAPRRRRESPLARGDSPRRRGGESRSPSPAPRKRRDGPVARGASPQRTREDRDGDYYRRRTDYRGGERLRPDGREPHSASANKEVEEDERARKLAAMQEAASELDKARERRLAAIAEAERAAQEADARARQQSKKFGGEARFVNNLHSRAADKKIADRIERGRLQA